MNQPWKITTLSLNGIRDVETRSEVTNENISDSNQSKEVQQGETLTKNKNQKLRK